MVILSGVPIFRIFTVAQLCGDGQTGVTPSTIEFLWFLSIKYSFSGTNDKAGGPQYLTRFVSPQSVKERVIPKTDWTYPSMKA